MMETDKKSDMQLVSSSENSESLPNANLIIK